jgi:3-phytase
MQHNFSTRGISMGRFKPALSLLGVAFLSFILCGAQKAGTKKAPSSEKPLPIPQVFRTQDWLASNVDSVALWRNPKGGALLFVTAKEAHVVYVCDGLTGTLLSTLGKQGKGLGEFLRPNGVAVVDDYLIVTERDNHRVQVFDLPSLKTVLFFGQDVLLKPYGLTVFRKDEAYELYVTDDYDVGNLGARVKHFRLTKTNGLLDAKLIRSFGELKGPGALRTVESILADPARDTLFICDEATNELKVYTLAGDFTGRTLGKGLIKYEPEGLALFEDRSAPAGGWLVVTDQGLKLTVLRIFTRDGSKYIGPVTGQPILANTDGITLSPGDLGPFKRGALFCVHNDIRVQAYSWADVERTLHLRDGK